METIATDSIVPSRAAGNWKFSTHVASFTDTYRPERSRYIPYYADTANVRELDDLLRQGADNEILEQIDGNTANQPLVRKVIASYSGTGTRHSGPMNCARISATCRRAVRRFAAGRPWEVSLQLHMGLCSDAKAAKQVGRGLRQMVPTACEGFGDLFYAPGTAEWKDLRRGKVPDMDSPLTFHIPVDTLYSLLADADFEKYQEEMDRENRAARQ